MKKVSVIIPCFNAALYIDRCLKSLEDQTLGIENLDIIAADDVSGDDTVKKLLEWKERFPDSIKVIEMQEHSLQGAARNAAIRQAEGDYIAFLDADDWLLPEALEHIYEKAVKSGAEITGYYSRTATGFSPDDRDYSREGKSRLIKLDGTKELIELLYTGITMRGCWDKMYKRNFVLNNELQFAEGVFDEESLFTIPGFLSAKKYYLLNEDLHRYYENLESTVFKLARDMSHRDDNAKTWFRLIIFLKDKGYLDREPEIIEALFLQNYFNRSFLINIPRGLFYDPDTVKNMQNTVHVFFPNYENNPILRQMRSLKYMKQMLDYPLNSENMQGFYDILGEFEANVGNEL